AIPVDPAVALLDPDQAPRDVVVDQLVALLMEVHTFRGDIAGDQHADRARLLLEVPDDLLLLDVADPAVEHLDLLCTKLEVLGELVAEPVQGADPFGEDHDARVAGLADADTDELLTKLVVLRTVLGKILLG